MATAATNINRLNQQQYLLNFCLLYCKAKKSGKSSMPLVTTAIDIRQS